MKPQSLLFSIFSRYEEGPGQEAGAQEGARGREEGRRQRWQVQGQVRRARQARPEGAEGAEEGCEGHAWHQGQEGPDDRPLQEAQDLQAGQGPQVPQEGDPQEEQVRNLGVDKEACLGSAQHWVFLHEVSFVRDGLDKIR